MSDKKANKKANKKADYLKAIKHLEAAVALLNKIHNEDKRDYDAVHYAHNIKELLSSDNDECGLKPFVKNFC